VRLNRNWRKKRCQKGVKYRFGSFVGIAPRANENTQLDMITPNLLHPVSQNAVSCDHSNWLLDGRMIVFGNIAGVAIAATEYQDEQHHCIEQSVAKGVLEWGHSSPGFIDWND